MPNGDGTNVRAISFAMHLKIVGAVVSTSVGLICLLGMRLYDVKHIPEDVAKSFHDYIEQEKATAAQTHDRIEGKVDAIKIDHDRRIGSLEDWRNRVAEGRNHER